MNLASAASTFINDSGTCRTRASVDTYRGELARLGAMFPRLNLDQFTVNELVQFCLANHPSDATIRRRRAILRGFFGWCAYKHMCPTNPASDLTYALKPGHAEVRTHSWLDEESIGHVVRSCPNDLMGDRDRLVLLIGFMLGLRRAEIAGLRWPDFSLDLSRVTLVGKGRKLVTLGVPPQLRDALKAWRRNAPVGTATVLPTFDVDRFGTRTVVNWDKPLGWDGVGRVVITAGERAGFPRLRPHDMRRSFAGVLERKGVPVADISRLLRHGDLGVTSRYLDKNPERVSALADTFELAL